MKRLSKRKRRFNRQHPRNPDGTFRKRKASRFNRQHPRNPDGTFRKRKASRKSPPPSRKKSPPPLIEKYRRLAEKAQRIFNLCKIADRRRMFQQFKSDRLQSLRKNKDIEVSDFRVVIDIEPSKKSKGKRKDKKRRPDRHRGKRVFQSFRKLSNFLNISGDYSGRSRPVNWSKAGVCKFEKKAYLGLAKYKGSRFIGIKPVRHYTLES